MAETQVQTDRPESELGKGRYEASPLVVALFGAAALLVLVAFVLVVVIKRVRARREDLGPISSRGSFRPGPPSSRPRAS